MTMIDKAKSSPTYKSIGHAANILSCLSNNIYQLTEIAQECKISKPKAYRLLKALEKTGLVSQDLQNHQYYFGSLFYELLSKVSVKHEQLLLYAISELESLAKYTEETVSLGILDRMRYFLLLEIPSIHDLKITDSLHKTPWRDYPTIPTPVKILLSQLDDDILQELFSLGYFKDKEPTLLSQIRLIKQQGYCVSYGLIVAGVGGIAAPIHNYRSPAVLTVLGPDVRVKNREASFLQETIRAANQISQKIKGKFTK